MIQQETVVVAGSNSKAFAYTLSDHLGFKYIEAELTKFADGELKVRISEQLNCETVIIVQSTNSSASENVMELLLIADAVRQSNNIKNVIALIPYFGYSRQDKQLVTQEAVAMRVLGKIIAAAGINHILTLDIHSPDSIRFFNIKFHNIDPSPLFLEAIHPFAQNYSIVAPDQGGASSANKIAAAINLPIVKMHKMRSRDNDCEILGMHEDVHSKNCIIIDDIIDTGKTMCNACNILKENGAKKVIAIATHAVFSTGAVARLENSQIDIIIITNSIEQSGLSKKFKIIDANKLICESFVKI